LATIKFNKRQEIFEETTRRLNEILIEKEKKEIILQLKADVSANIYKSSRNNYRMKVFNRGKGDANNVRIFVEDNNQIINQEEINSKFPYSKLAPLQNTELMLYIHMSSPRTLIVKLMWDDCTCSDNELDLNLSVPYG